MLKQEPASGEVILKLEGTESEKFINNRVEPLYFWYLWWSLCISYLLTRKVRVAVGDSGLCCCVHVMSSDH